MMNSDHGHVNFFFEILRLIITHPVLLYVRRNHAFLMFVLTYASVQKRIADFQTALFHGISQEDVESRACARQRARSSCSYIATRTATVW